MHIRGGKEYKQGLQQIHTKTENAAISNLAPNCVLREVPLSISEGESELPRGHGQSKINLYLAGPPSKNTTTTGFALTSTIAAQAGTKHIPYRLRSTKKDVRRFVC